MEISENLATPVMGGYMESVQLKLQDQWNSRLKLYDEGSKLYAEGNKLWAEAILEAYGNITYEWNYSTGSCTLENGDMYEE